MIAALPAAAAEQPGSLVLVEAALAGHCDRNYSRSRPVLEMKMEGVEGKKSLSQS